ncbi:MAG: hypothetical protein P4L84_29665 [Isosphaeraceae bacterium]|nr:hypothetical protein [Isosphaeraceae bacterium]
MRKRAGTLRCSRLGLDSLEERTLLSAIVAFPEARPVHDAIVQQAQPMGPEGWNGWGFEAGTQHLSAFTGSTDSMPLAKEGGGAVMALGATSFATPAVMDALRAEKALELGVGATSAVTPMVMVMNLPGPFSSASSQVLGAPGPVSTESGGGAAAVHLVTLHDVAAFWDGTGSESSASAPGDTPYLGGSVGALVSVFPVGHWLQGLQESGFFPNLVHVGPLQYPAPHGSTDLLPVDRYDSVGDPTDMGGELVLPDAHETVLVGGNAGSQAASAAEGRDVIGPQVSYSIFGGVALAPRVAVSGRELTPSLDFARDGERPLTPVTGVSISSVEDLAAIATQAAGATAAAVGSVIAGRAEAEAAPVRGTAPQAGAITPEPQGLGLIAELLPYDGDTVTAAIDRFFEQFEDPSADRAEDFEPAALYPPPGAVLIAVAAVEIARRHFKRRNEEDAATPPRRRNVEGLRFDESFGSSGPWSSRLS